LNTNLDGVTACDRKRLCTTAGLAGDKPFGDGR
jgi:hypothetical protein